MKIILCGGGTGGHITPLLAVAHELKRLQPDCYITAVCEKGSHFIDLFVNDPSIDQTRQISAGKYRRYFGQSLIRRLTDIKTLSLNGRDVFNTVAGYKQARKLLKELRPDKVLIKGGFVGVPVGLAAAGLGIPFITHDSDSVPGLANRIIARWAAMHATGMPADFYDYPKSRMVYTGTPVTSTFEPLDDASRHLHRTSLGLGACKQVITIIGGSQGADRLNKDFIAIAGRLMQRHEDLGIVHIAGRAHEQASVNSYKKELLADELRRVVIKGFVDDAFRYTGAADIVVTRASATFIAELSIQGQACVAVPGQLAGGHQQRNAGMLKKDGLAEVVEFGDSEGLYVLLDSLLNDESRRRELAANLSSIAKPQAARELAELMLTNLKEMTDGGI